MFTDNYIQALELRLKELSEQAPNFNSALKLLHPSIEYILLRKMSHSSTKSNNASFQLIEVEETFFKIQRAVAHVKVYENELCDTYNVTFEGAYKDHDDKVENTVLLELLYSIEISFILFFSLLDKSAQFLNTYLDLGFTEQNKNVTLETVVEKIKSRNYQNLNSTKLQKIIDIRGEHKTNKVTGLGINMKDLVQLRNQIVHTINPNAFTQTTEELREVKERVGAVEVLFEFTNDIVHLILEIIEELEYQNPPESILRLRI